MIAVSTKKDLRNLRSHDLFFVCLYTGDGKGIGNTGRM